MLLTILNVLLLFLPNQPLIDAADWYDEASWESKKVNPYMGRSMKLPDKVVIDCTQFFHPTDGLGRLSDKYGWRKKVNRMHRGVDISIPLNTPIFSSWPGVIRVRGNEPKGYGLYIVVRHDNGLETVYAHLSKQLVNRGDRVKAGSLIGLSGNTGRSTGPHLHFETRYLGGDFNPTYIIDFTNNMTKTDIFVWTKSMYPKRKKNISLLTYRVKEDTTLEELCSVKGWDLEDTCLSNGLLPDMELSKGRLIRYIK